MAGNLGLRRKECAERNIVRPGFARFHGEVAAVHRGHADLRVAAKPRTRVRNIAIVLPQMDPIGAKPFGQADRIVDDKRHIARCAYFHQRLCQFDRSVFVDILDAKLERSHRPRLDRADQAFGKGTRHIERRYQVKLAIGYDSAATGTVFSVDAV